MSAVLHRIAVLPTSLLGGPPLVIAIAVGMGIHRHRNRKAHR